MNIVVIGLGSMGKRRIGLINGLYSDYKIFGVDTREDRRMETSATFNISCFESIESIKEDIKIDAAFICTSPLSHSTIITECLKRKWHVFTELNLVPDGYEYNMKLAKSYGCKLFLSSTFFYREEIKYICKKVEANGQWNYIYHIGQYLPDWHPWENYKDFFVGNKRTNGCREIMAIELPWLIKAFGCVVNVIGVGDKITGLSIDYKDNYMLQLTHENGNKGILVVDIVSPVAVRRLEVYGENKYLQWSGTPDSLLEYNERNSQLEHVALTEEAEYKEGYRAFVVENAYRNEIIEFFDVINGKEQQYGFEQDLKTLELIDKLEHL